ncbi:uncharacterized protein V6R79_019562 [Siganus canaliculatus]
MSTLLDETAADVPVRDAQESAPTAAPEAPALQNARARQDVSRVSREELENRFLCLHDENLQLKHHVHRQDDKIKKLGTKLMRLVKDRRRMEQLAAGGGRAASRLRDVEMEEVMEELQEKVRGLQAENERLKQRLQVAKLQLLDSQRRPSAYTHVPPRVNSGLKKLRDAAASSPPPRPKSFRSLEGGARPPTGLLPRFGHSLLEDARAEIRNLENVVEQQQNRMEEVERHSALLQDELRRKEEEHEEQLEQLHQQHASKFRAHISSNVSMIRMQRQLENRCNAVTELEGRFLQLQETQKTLEAAHQASLDQVKEQSTLLQHERSRTLELEAQLQSSSMDKTQLQQLQEQLSEVEQEKKVLKENYDKLLISVFDVSQQQRWQIQEQQLRLQIEQLETALKADLVDKNEILDQVKAERESRQQLQDENKRLQIQNLEKQQQLEQVWDQLRVHKEVDYDAAELTEALLLIRSRRSQRSQLGLEEVGEESASSVQAAHAETILELQKTRTLLSVESRICRDYQVELETLQKKMEADRVQHEQRLQSQAQILDSRAAKILQLKAKLRAVAYCTRSPMSRPQDQDQDQDEDQDEDWDDSGLQPGPGQNVLELNITGAALSPSALDAMGDGEAVTFCTYSFYRSELHSTPLAEGRAPRYGFTSRYVVDVDQRFLDYLQGGCISVELHQALGGAWRTLAAAQLPLQQLLEQDGKVHGCVALLGASAELRPFGSVDYWLRLRRPIADAARLHRETAAPGARWNQIHVTVQRCRDLRAAASRPPSPYVGYGLHDFPDHLTATVHDCCTPDFNDLKTFSVHMDADLDRYLRTEPLQVYVFDHKEEKMDEYLGKTRVPLLGLSQGHAVSGEFQLTDPGGLHAGHIQMTLSWEHPYNPPPETIRTQDLPEVQRPDQLQSGHESEPGPLKSPGRAKRVTFTEAPPPPAVTSTTEEEEESEGHLVLVSSQSTSTDSEELMEDLDQVPAASEDRVPAASENRVPAASESDSDDGIVHRAAAGGRKASERLRVEVLSLSLRPESRVAQDSSIVRLFVEYSLLDQTTEETPLSLPKAPDGRTINYNYSKVFPVDPEDHAERRRLLRRVLQGGDPQLERIRFTVVSDPPEEEQDRECEDVGVAFLRIPDILETQQDLTETSLTVVDVEDSSEVVGSLTVTVEGLEALQAIIQDQDQDQDQEQPDTCS